MTTIQKRPVGTQFNMQNVQKEKEYNQNVRYVQGFRNAIAASSTTPVPITLNSAGRLLLGISVMPSSGTLADIADTQITFVVNNNNVLLTVAAQNLCPNYVQGFLFFPTPQDLKGNDTMSLSVIKNNAGAITLNINIFYVPRM